MTVDVTMDPPPPGETIYYGLIDTIGSRENPASIIRRTRGEGDMPVDEALHRDLQWHPSEYLYRYWLGLGEYDDIIELSEDEVRLIMERWRRKWAAEGDRRH
jgi:hypothetical protein